MITLRWAAGLIIAICLAIFMSGVRDWFLAAFTFLVILIFLRTFRTTRKDQP